MALAAKKILWTRVCQQTEIDSGCAIENFKLHQFIVQPLKLRSLVQFSDRELRSFGFRLFSFASSRPLRPPFTRPIFVKKIQGCAYEQTQRR